MSFPFGKDYRRGKQKQKSMERFMDAEARFLHADSLLERGEIAEAKQMLIGILEDEPDFGRAHNHLGWLYRVKLSNFERAEYHLRLAVKFAPDFPAGYLNYCHLLMETSEFEKLGELAEKALTVRGIFLPAVYHFLAVVAEKKGELQVAMKWLLKARESASDEGTVTHIKSEIRRVKSKMNAFGRIALLF